MRWGVDGTSALLSLIWRDCNTVNQQWKHSAWRDCKNRIWLVAETRNFPLLHHGSSVVSIFLLSDNETSFSQTKAVGCVVESLHHLQQRHVLGSAASSAVHFIWSDFPFCRSLHVYRDGVCMCAVTASSLQSRVLYCVSWAYLLVLDPRFSQPWPWTLLFSGKWPGAVR
jgi:hypothetical protein